MIKQTQTKTFKFSDKDLDICSGSRAKYKETFKKIFTTGYNHQTVTSVSVSGSQITLSYSLPHGYAGDRVLKVIASGGFAKEVYIDYVTDTTIVCSVLDGVTTGLSGSITTNIAPLGWSIVYDVGNSQVYQLKALDDSSLYARFVYPTGSIRGRISVCVGMSFDSETGYITDTYAHKDTSSVSSASSSFAWELGYHNSSTFDNYTYGQDSRFGNGVITGSIYHVITMSNTGQSTSDAPYGTINAILPVSVLNYPNLKLPIVIGYNYAQSSSVSSGLLSSMIGYIGDIKCAFSGGSSTTIASPQSRASYLPTSIDGFSTTTCSPTPIYEYETKQFLGYLTGGLYICAYASSGTPEITVGNLPQLTVDIDFSVNCYVHHVNQSSSAANTVFFVSPVEEIKLA